MLTIRSDGNSEVVERLTDFGANPSQSDEIGWTPLHYVSRNSLLVATDLFQKWDSLTFITGSI